MSESVEVQPELEAGQRAAAYMHLLDKRIKNLEKLAGVTDEDISGLWHEIVEEKMQIEQQAEQIAEANEEARIEEEQ